MPKIRVLIIDDSAAMRRLLSDALSGDAAIIRSLDKKVPILMITTEAEKQRVVEAIQAGVSDYLIKPFSNEALDRKLIRFMEQV